MRKKTVTILIVISTVINIFAAAFIFLDLQVMQAPDTAISMEIVEINSKEAVIESKIDIDNPNSFEIIVRDLVISLTTPKGDEISSLRIEGKKIPANNNKTFVGTSVVNYGGYSPEKLVSKVSGVVGMKVGFIEKTLPISVEIVSDMEEMFSNIAPPSMNIQTSFDEITQKNVNITVEIESHNPNAFDIVVEDIFIDMKNDTGVSVGNLPIPKIALTANSKVTVNGSGIILIEALNAKFILINISGNASATIAGFEKTLPFNVESKVTIPDLETLLPSKVPTDAVIRSDYRASISGFISDITLEAHNPHNIEYNVKDITIEVYRIDKNTKRKVGEGTIEPGVLKANNITALKGSFQIPYRKMFIPPLGGRFIPEWLEITIRANVTIKGLNNYFWVGMVAYQDFHLFRKDRAYDSPKIVEWNP